MDKEQMEAAKASEAALKAAHAAQESELKALEDSGAIDDALLSDLSSLDGKPSVAPAPAVAAEKKADHTPSDSPKPEVAPEKVAPKVEAEKKEQPPESTPDQDGETSKRSRDRWAKQLHEKNEAKRQAEELEKENSELRKKLEAAEAKEVDALDEEDEPGPTGDVAEIVRQTLRQEKAAEEARNTEFKGLFNDHPEAKDHLDDINDEMRKHPTLSPLGAYLHVNPSAFAKGAAGMGHEGNMDAGSRMNPAKLESKLPYQMNDQELDEEVNALAAAGMI